MRASLIARQAAPVKSWSLANGQRIPKVGFGTWKLSKEQAHQSVAHALKTGYRQIDSAWAYKNEDATGDAIRKSGVKREDLFITSKLWNTFHGDKVEAGLDASLKDLGVDYLDLYLMHWPVAFSNPNTSQISSLRSTAGYPVEEVKLSQDLATTWHNMEEMVRKGKVRSIGISNFNIRRTEQLLKAGLEHAPAINQVEVNFGVPNTELLHYSEAHQIILQAYSTLGAHTYREKYLNDPIIGDVAQRNNMTPAQVMVAWPLARGIIPLTRSTSPAHIEENFAAANMDLPWDDVVHLTEEAQARPIDRSMDPSETWNTEEDIFEDYKDQNNLNALYTDSFHAPPAHEADGSHYLEPRNDPNAPQLGPGGTAIREMHTSATSRARGSGLSARASATVTQRMMRSAPFAGQRSFGTSASSSATAAVETEPPAAEEVPVVGQSVLLRNTAKAATQTPGIQWTDGEQGIERQARKMNMYTVRDQRRSRQQQQLRSMSTSGAAASAAVASVSDLSLSSPSILSTLFPNPPVKRKYSERKEFLFGQYKRLLDQSKVVVLLQPNSLDVPELQRIRSDLAAVKPEAATAAGQEGEAATPAKARLTVVRSGVLRKVMHTSSSQSLRQAGSLIFGPLAMLTFDNLSPNYISRVMSVLDKALGAGRAAAKPAAHKPHAKVVKNVNTRLTPLAAVIEHSPGVKVVVDIPSLRDLSTMPSLDVLRSQIVGLLSAVPSQLVATLNQARGSELALTLDAHRRALEKNESGPSSS